MKHDRNEIIRDNPIVPYLENLGYSFRRKGRDLYCLCPFHPDKSASLRVNEEKQVWFCDPCSTGGSIIDFVMKDRNCSSMEAMELLSGKNAQETLETPRPLSHPLEQKKTIPRPLSGPRNGISQNGSTPQYVEKCHYDYKDPLGIVKFQVIRYEPKNFKQRKVNEDGSYTWNMDGVERFPFNLPDVLSSETVIIVEGERDVETLQEIGLIGTCNPGGAKKWLSDYARYLEGKKIIIIPDNDDPGLDHAKMVLKTLEGKVESVKWLELPREISGTKIKDVTDLREFCKTPEKFAEELGNLVRKSRLISRGVDSDIVTMEELQFQYKADLVNESSVSMDLRKWLPSLRVRPLIPGDLLGIIAPTSSGKSASVQNLLACCPELKQLLFEIELAQGLMFERSVAVATGISADKVHSCLSKGEWIDWKKTNKLNNLYFCFRSNVTMQYIDEQIERSAAKIGQIPNIFVIDYLQLIRKEKSTRYEAIGDAAETAKLLAKKWGCIGIVLSQIGRKQEDDSPEPKLTDAKNAGEIENSCGLLLGLHKTAKDRMSLRVLKNTKGETGQRIPIMFHGPSLTMKELKEDDE